MLPSTSSSLLDLVYRAGTKQSDQAELASTMPALSSIIMALQGLFGILNGAASLISSAALQKNLDTLQIDSIPALHAIALGSVSIG